MKTKDLWKIGVFALLLLVVFWATRYCPKRPDADQDKVPDKADNCPTVPNTKQANADGDGLGDACDPCPEVAALDDRDLDCVADASDNCPSLSNRDQTDWDSDNLGDVCDDCPADSTNKACQDWFAEAFVLPVSQWSLYEKAEYNVCFKRSEKQAAAYIIGPRFDNTNLRLDECRVYAKGEVRKDSPGRPVTIPRRYSMNRPVGIGCPDPEDPFIDVVEWKPGNRECVTVPLEYLYEIDRDALGMERGGILVCNLSGRFVTKGIKDPGPPVFNRNAQWDEADLKCRDPGTGLINITPVDQVLETLGAVQFLDAIPAEIDIRPDRGDSIDTLRPGSSPELPVVIMGSKDLDVAQIVVATIVMTGRGDAIRSSNPRKAEEKRADVTGDKVKDLLIHIDLDVRLNGEPEGYAYLNFDLADGTRGLGRNRIRVDPSAAK